MILGRLTAVGVMSALAFGGAASAADVSHGGQVYAAQCGMCHGPAGAGGPAGPSLAGVVGRKAASVPFSSYSAALRRAGWVWMPAKLGGLPREPPKRRSGHQHACLGGPRRRSRADLIAYLSGLKAGSPTARPARRASLDGGGGLGDE